MSKSIVYNSTGIPAFFDEQGQQITEADWMALQPPPAPDWLSVRISLLGSVEYNAIAAAAGDQRAVTRLEAAAMNSTHEWALLAQLWNAVVDSLPAAPPAADIAAIAAILSQGNLPVSLDPNTGEMSPSSE